MSSELGSFTPIPHSLAQEVGLVCAAVYGVVWRKCQMKKGICKASLDTLGTDINVDRATVLRNIKKLCELGYLVDLTPDRRNAPHDYVLAKTVAECNSSMSESVAENNSTEGETVAYNNSSKQTVAQSKATVAESYLKIDSEETKDIKEEKEATAAFAQISSFYQNEIGPLSPMIRDKLLELCTSYPAEWIKLAISGAVEQNARKISYVRGTLENWQAIGGPQNDKPKGQYKNGNGPYQNRGHPASQGETAELTGTSLELSNAWKSKARKPIT